MLAESSCAYTKIKPIEHYSNEEHYIEVTGTISHVVFDDEYKTLYLGFSDLSDTFADNTFELTGRNYSIVADAARESIEVGRTATFVTAPRYFFDGYIMPIVSFTIYGECLLEYEERLSNFLDWLKK